MQLDLELYRRDVVVAEQPPLRLSVIDIDPGVSQGTMVFLHGFGGQALQWKAQVTFFAEDYRIVAPDLRGHGRSDKPHTQYTIDEMLNDVDGLLREMHVPEKFTLFGHSFGGAIAAVLAARHLERAEATNRAIQRFLGPASAAWRAERERRNAQLVRERPWLPNYEPGVPYTIIAPSQPLQRLIGSAARRHANRPATIFYGAALTWQQIWALSNRFANALRA